MAYYVILYLEEELKEYLMTCEVLKVTAFIALEPLHLYFLKLPIRPSPLEKLNDLEPGAVRSPL